MTMIYSKALSIYAWLGTPLYDIYTELPKAMDFINILVKTDTEDISTKLLPNDDVALSTLTVGLSFFLKLYWKDSR